MKRAIIATALAIALTGCNQEFTDGKHNRDDVRYKAAMSALQAGRIDEAIAGFTEVLKTSPANVSARFQLACLQHEYKKDYLDAMIGYRIYSQLASKSDKSQVADDRAQMCEDAYEAALSDKIRERENAAAAAEIAELKAKVAELEEAGKAKDNEIAAKDKELKDIQGENVRIRRLVAAVGAGESTNRVVVADDSFKKLLDEEEDDEDRIRFSKDVAALVVDEEQEKEDTATPFEQQEPKAEESQPDAAGTSGPEVAAGDGAPALPQDAQITPPEPGTKYVVQDGDTLYKIAKEKYGKASEWKRIREANKAVISADGRVKAGQEIILP